MNKLKTLFILCVMLAITAILPTAASAVNAGYGEQSLLLGKRINIVGGGTTNNVTDDKQSTFIYTANTALYYVLPEPIRVDQVWLHMTQGRFTLKLTFEDNTTQTFNINNSGTSGVISRTYNVTNKHKKLTRFDLDGTTSGSGGTLYEIDMRINGENYDTSPPTGLKGKPGNAMATLTWNAVEHTYLKGYYVYRDGTKISGLLTDTTYEDTGLINDTTYIYTIKSVNIYDQESDHSAAVSVTPTVDLTPPDPPTGLSAAVGSQKAQLFWAANTEPDLAGYHVYRDGVRLTNTLITATIFNNTGLINDTEYIYTVTAVDTSGNESLPSAPLSVIPNIPPDTEPPAAPSGIQATPGIKAIYVSWTANSDPDLAGYFIYRNGVRVNGTPITVTFLNDLNLEDGRYEYQVTAVDTSFNESQPSQRVTVNLVSVPSNVRASAGYELINVSWFGVPGATEYRIYRDGVQIATTTDLTYLDEGLSNGTTYSYEITAIVNEEESARSTPANAIPGELLQFEGTGKPPGISGVAKSAYSFITLYNPILILVLTLILVITLIALVIWIVRKARERVEWEKVKQAELRDLRDPEIRARMEATSRRLAMTPTRGRIEGDDQYSGDPRQARGQIERYREQSINLRPRREVTAISQPSNVRDIREAREIREGRIGRDGRK